MVHFGLLYKFLADGGLPPNVAGPEVANLPYPTLWTGLLIINIKNI